MEKVIIWCNNNNGFLTGILSLLTLLVSIIAIGVSIRTARLPFKKKIKLGSKISILVGENFISRDICSQLGGITVEAINLGNRNVNITFLGLAVKEFGKPLQTLQTTNRLLGGTGILSPTQVSNVEYSVAELNSLNRFKPKVKLFCCATDSEGKTYRKYYGRVGVVLNNIQKL